MKILTFGVFVAGPKGLALFAGIAKSVRPSFVVSYRQNASSCTYEDIYALAKKLDIEFLERKDFLYSKLENVELAFVAGWQFLIDTSLDKLAVFHDSLLPKYRGFSPTVTALINGEERLGVSLIQPCEEMDAGPLLGQRSFSVSYPCTISSAYAILADEYVKLALDVLQNGIQKTPQNKALATYSIWRGRQDYEVDWCWPAEKIVRFVDALGPPYEGAISAIGKEIVKLVKVEAALDLNFVERAPGKIWSITNKEPVIVCGSGMVQIKKAEYLDGSSYQFKKLRTQFENIDPSFFSK